MTSSWVIPPVSTILDEQIWAKINGKTKPPGSLGKLESIAFKLARIQQSLSPTLTKPHVLIFAGDHGIAKEGKVNPYPQEVTYQMVFNFLNGGAAINAMAKATGMEVQVVDAGVNYDFGSLPSLIDAKIAMGTSNYRLGPAMSQELCSAAMNKGAQIVSDLASKGTNVIGFGEMGIGNSSSAALIMSTICHFPLDECIGLGTASDDTFLEQKLRTLRSVATHHQLNSESSPVEVLSTFGGFELAQIAGGMLEAGSRGLVILVDGFISSAAFLVAQKIAPSLSDYAIFSHLSEEQGHLKMLEYLQVEPLLNYGLRLGEGTGCAAAYPSLKMAVSIINQMASFESAGVQKA